ncbi:hypothetical protein [Xanthomonas cerealis]|uniref:hypothetical protein n=1 Tax=Xanthomonas cerealis TaxID=3390025 RepID=UPI001F22A262|nr:hypothetical protein [Xanthomonas translucens]
MERYHFDIYLQEGRHAAAAPIERRPWAKGLPSWLPGSALRWWLLPQARCLARTRAALLPGTGACSGHGVRYGRRGDQPSMMTTGVRSVAR